MSVQPTVCLPALTKGNQGHARTLLFYIYTYLFSNSWLCEIGCDIMFLLPEDGYKWYSGQSGSGSFTYSNLVGD